MKVFVILIFSISIIFYKNILHSEEIKKVVFEINGDIYTTIDLENRKKYLILKGDNILENIDDFTLEYLRILLYSYEYDSITNQDINKITDDFYNQFFFNNEKIKNNSKLTSIYKNLGESNIRTNIEQDLKRKIILENMLEGKIQDIFNANSEGLLDIYDIYIEYYVFDKITKKELETMVITLDYENIKNNIEKINMKEIDFYYNKKKISNIDKINETISNNIINNKNKFIIEQTENIMIGKISKIIKNEESINYKLYQILEKNIMNIKDLKCDNLKKIDKTNTSIEFKELNAKYSKLNNTIKINLKEINDYIILTNNSKKSYLILCGIDYNKEILKDTNTKQKINKIILDFDNKFYKQKSKEFNSIIN